MKKQGLWYEELVVRRRRLDRVEVFLSNTAADRLDEFLPFRVLDDISRRVDASEETLFGRQALILVITSSQIESLLASDARVPMDDGEDDERKVESLIRVLDEMNEGTPLGKLLIT